MSISQFSENIILCLFDETFPYAVSFSPSLILILNVGCGRVRDGSHGFESLVTTSFTKDDG